MADHTSADPKTDSSMNIEQLRMFATKRCKKRHQDRNEPCFYWHGTEVSRRVPFDVIDGMIYLRYDHSICKRVRWIDIKNDTGNENFAEACQAGSYCKFAHSIWEVLYHPMKYKTQKCKHGEQCNKLHCASWHSETEKQKWDNYRATYFKQASINLRIGLEVCDITWGYLRNVVRIILNTPMPYEQNCNYATTYKPIFDTLFDAQIALEYPLNALDMTSFIADPLFHSFTRDEMFVKLHQHFVQLEREFAQNISASVDNNTLFVLHSDVNKSDNERSAGTISNSDQKIGCNGLDTANKILDIYDYLISGAYYILGAQKKEPPHMTPVFIGSRLSFRTETNSVVPVLTDTQQK